MPSAISDRDCALVRNSSPIALVIGSCQLSPTVNGRLEGSCPLHDDPLPSLAVNPGAGYFRCFSCRVQGDVFTWLMAIHGLAFQEAVRRLAVGAGVELTSG